MRIILIGPPNSGKGTQAQWMSLHYGIPHLSTGDLLRNISAEEPSIIQAVSTHLNKGQLVPDELVIQLITARMQQQDCQNGFLLDGFPRTLSQMKQLHALIRVDIVIIFDLADEVIIKRFSGRRLHPQSGRTYHIEYNPPRVPDIDDVTQEPLIRRADDSLAVLKQRLSTYHEQTQPVMEYYQRWAKHGSQGGAAPSCCVISQAASIESIRRHISEFISKR